MLPGRRYLLRSNLACRLLNRQLPRSRLLCHSTTKSSSLLPSLPAARSHLYDGALHNGCRTLNTLLNHNTQQRWQSTSANEDTLDDDDAIPFEVLKQKAPAHTTPAVLPVSCPGCGAFTQWVYPDEAGFYTLSRRSVKAYLKSHSPKYDATDAQALQPDTAEPSNDGSNPTTVPRGNHVDESKPSEAVTEKGEDAQKDADIVQSAPKPVSVGDGANDAPEEAPDCEASTAKGKDTQNGAAVLEAASDPVSVNNGARDTPLEQTPDREGSRDTARQDQGQCQSEEDQPASKMPESDEGASLSESQDSDTSNAHSSNSMACDTMTGSTDEVKTEDTAPETAKIEESTNPAQDGQDPTEASTISEAAIEKTQSEPTEDPLPKQDAPHSETRAPSLENDKASHTSQEPPEVPICDRCHNLKNHAVAPPIPCPPISYVRDLLEESPYQYNHVYHIIDAADFPLTLIPNIYRELDLQEQRSKNRRSKLSKYEGGQRKSVVSFVITRSDLLAATKEQVDHLMPYIINVLRNRLGIQGDRARLGNVHMVSAHRGWWTKEVKEKIRDHAGGVWMVGKTNVGKSNLLSTVFPKRKPVVSKNKKGGKIDENQSQVVAQDEIVEDDPESILPPRQPQAIFPVFPIVSSMPGTTALPVRIPFFHAKGEVIDLPGLEREGLEPYVKDEYLNNLVMSKRIKSERMTIRPGQSLLIGGLIRITPLDPDLVVLAAPFYNMPSHVTATNKAVALHTQEHSLPNISIAKDGIGADIASAGVFSLNDDVTRVYGQYDKFGKSLPYAVMATDILIEGCGWVEVIAQIRRKQLEAGFVPRIEVFSPKGRFVASRPSMSAYSFQLEKSQKTARQSKSRPRKSMRRVRLTSRGPLKKKSS